MYKLITHPIFHHKIPEQIDDQYSDRSDRTDEEEETTEEAMHNQLKSLFTQSLNVLNGIEVPEIQFELGHLKQMKVSMDAEDMNNIIFKCDIQSRKLSLTIEDVKAIAEIEDVLVTSNILPNLVKGQAKLTASNITLRLGLNYTIN